MHKHNIISLSEPEPKTVRFLSGFHASLEEGKNTSWVTVTRTGKFYDPRYGEFEITKPMLLTMVVNFDKRVYGQDIFLDVAHQPSNGAAAKVTILKVEGDRLRALVEWTPYGIDAVKNKGYTYLSAEFTENFQDNEQRQFHGPVLFGAGLTVRPVIKRLDPVTLSCDSDSQHPTFIHPELQTTLLQEITMWKQTLLAAFAATLVSLKLAEPVAQTLTTSLTKALEPLTDEAHGKALATAFEDSAKKLSEQIGDKVIKLDISIPNISTGLSADEVKKLMQQETERIAVEQKTLAEKTANNVKLLTDAINAVAGFDDETKKELADNVKDLINADMSADQIKKLADNQISLGNKLSAAKKLTSMGFQFPAGHVHISVDDSNTIKALQQSVDQRMGITDRTDSKRFSNTGGQLQDANKKYADKVLAMFDAEHAAQLHAEHKSLAAGDGKISDVAIPAIFERTVIREALYNLIGLQFVDVGVLPFSQTALIPYSYRDTTAAGINNARVYEGGSIPRAGVKQASDTAYPIPQKIAFEVSDELRYLTGNGQLNWDSVSENQMNASRIINEDTERLIFDEILNASDQYGAAAVVSEAVGTGNGTKTIFPVAQFPVVKPKTIYDLQGNVVGSTVYPITVTVNGVSRPAYDGTNGQAAGIYWIMDYNLGELRFVNELGVATAVTNTHAIVASYNYATNTYKYDTDMGSASADVFWEGFLYRYGVRKSVIEDQRYYMANFGLMSGAVRNQIEQAKSFVNLTSRNGTSLDANGNLGLVKDVPNYKTTAPGLAMGDQRVVIGERGNTRMRMMKPWTMGDMENQKDSNGRFTGKKEAYGDQFIVLHTPSQLKGGYTSISLYSSSARVSR